MNIPIRYLKSNRLILDVALASRQYLSPGSRNQYVVEELSRPVTVGRIETADLLIDSAQVSRRHARLDFNGAEWLVTDEGSKLGTFVNWKRISPNSQKQLRHGDVLKIGPIELAVTLEGARDRENGLSEGRLLTSDLSVKSSIIASDLDGSVSVLHENSLGGLAQHRLKLLLSSAECLSAAECEEALAISLTEAASQGTNAPRVLFLDLGAEDWKVLSVHDEGAKYNKEITLSRSLVHAAQKGKIAKLDFDNISLAHAASVQALNIQSALCVPVFVDGIVAAALYLDARDLERQLNADAAAYCVAIAQLGGMALGNLRRAELAASQRALQCELKAAREAQEKLLPPSDGTLGGIHYSLSVQPGTIVAGDLFDVISIDDRRTLVVLGDVMGKGAGAGLIMAAIQTFLSARAADADDLVSLVQSANRFFVDRFKQESFVTLWIGVFDSSSRTVDFVDAGHGLWRHLTCNRAVAVESAGGPPLGAIVNPQLQSERLSLAPSDRILLFSDGLVEQANPQGDLFGSLEIFENLTKGNSPREDVTFLIENHQSFRRQVDLTDDLTIASIQFRD